jgi:hypothetical protein
MKKKIVGMVVLMLVATAVVSATDINVKKDNRTATSMDVLSCNNKIDTYLPQPEIPGLNWGVDQKQTSHVGYGWTLIQPYSYAQSFTPTKDKLTAISIGLFKAGSPPEPVEFTVSIRDNLSGPDLVTTTKDTTEDPIDSAEWILFDFGDISITPGSIYYIVVSGNGGNNTNAYCWLFSAIDLYPQGNLWTNETGHWVTNSRLDFCFKTYFRKPLDIPVLKNNENLINPWFLSIAERFPNAFPILRHLMGY